MVALVHEVVVTANLAPTQQCGTFLRTESAYRGPYLTRDRQPKRYRAAHRKGQERLDWTCRPKSKRHDDGAFGAPRPGRARATVCRSGASTRPAARSGQCLRTASRGEVIGLRWPTAPVGGRRARYSPFTCWVPRRRGSGSFREHGPVDAAARPRRAAERRGFYFDAVQRHTHIPVDIRPVRSRKVAWWRTATEVLGIRSRVVVRRGVYGARSRDLRFVGCGARRNRVAKAVASIDTLSSGRFVFGVGWGWLREEVEGPRLPGESTGGCRAREGRVDACDLGAR